MGWEGGGGGGGIVSLARGEGLLDARKEKVENGRLCV